MTFDPTKPVQTRGGLPVRILCTDRQVAGPPERLCIVGLVRRGGGEVLWSWNKDGSKHLHFSSDLDLINIPVKKWRWAINNTAQGVGPFITRAYYSEEEIKNWHFGDRIIGRIAETEITE